MGVYTIAPSPPHSKIPSHLLNLGELLLLEARGAQGCRVHQGCKTTRLGKTAWEANPTTNSTATCGVLGVSHTGSTKQQIFIFVSENFLPHLTVYFGKVTD